MLRGQEVSVVRRFGWLLVWAGLPACYGSHNETGDGGSDGTTTDTGADTAPHDATDDGGGHDTADTADVACTLDPSARTGGAYAVTSLEVIRPAVFGGVAPTLTARIDDDDIFVVLGTDISPVGPAFHLEVGPAVERLYPEPRAQYCRDELCGWPPNQITIYDATWTCDEFATASPADLVFSLYPPSHPAAATPLRIVGASIRGRFDATRSRIVEGTVTGGILEDSTPLVYPMFDVSLDELLTAAGVAKDFDINRDTIPDGWSVELRFEASWIALEDG
jgi:hypothetical protein